MSKFLLFFIFQCTFSMYTERSRNNNSAQQPYGGDSPQDNIEEQSSREKVYIRKRPSLQIISGQSTPVFIRSPNVQSGQSTPMQYIQDQNGNWVQYNNLPLYPTGLTCTQGPAGGQSPEQLERNMQVFQDNADQQMQRTEQTALTASQEAISFSWNKSIFSLTLFGISAILIAACALLISGYRGANNHLIEDNDNYCVTKSGNYPSKDNSAGKATLGVGIFGIIAGVGCVLLSIFAFMKPQSVFI